MSIEIDEKALGVAVEEVSLSLGGGTDDPKIWEMHIAVCRQSAEIAIRAYLSALGGEAPAVVGDQEEKAEMFHQKFLVECVEQTERAMAESAHRAPSPKQDGGEWIMAPRESTQEMRDAAIADYNNEEKHGPHVGKLWGSEVASMYKAMMAVTPKHAPSPSFEAGVEAAAQMCDQWFKEFEAIQNEKYKLGERTIEAESKADAACFLAARIRTLKSGVPRSLSPQQGEGWHVPEGWQIVPKEPVIRMKLVGGKAALDAGDDIRTGSAEAAACAYRAMLAVAPSPPSRKEGE